MLGLVALASLVSFEARWQFGQSKLEATANELDCILEYRPRGRLWQLGSYLTLRPTYNYISGVSFFGYQAESSVFKTPVIVDSDKLIRLLELPAMREVELLSLKGTAVTSRCLAELAKLEALESLEMDFTAVEEKELEALEQLLTCRTKFGASNGNDFLELAHSPLTDWTQEVGQFRLARRGDAQAIEGLVRCTAASRKESLRLFREAIPTKNPEVVKLLRTLWDSDNREVRWNVAVLMCPVGNEEFASLALKDAAAEIRLLGVRSLALNSTVFARRQLIECAADQDSRVRSEAIQLMGQSGSIECERALVRIAAEGGLEDAICAINALAFCSSDRAFATLEAATTHSNGRIRAAAAEALGRFGSADAKALLSRASRDRSVTVREAARKALRNLEN